MEIVVQTLFLTMHSHLYSFTEPLPWAQEKGQIINNNSTIKSNNNISIYCHRNNSPRTNKHKVLNSGSGSS